MDDKSLVLPGAIFALFSIAMIWPPDEFVSAGATFEHLFYRWIGDFSLNIVEYQLRKILVNRVCVACLPALFSLYIILNVPPTALSTFVATAGLASMIMGLAYAFYTISTNFSQTRQVKELALYGGDVHRLMTEITQEYLEFANFAVSFAHSSREVVGSHWLIHITRFDFTIVNLTDVVFEVVRSATVDLNIERPNDQLQFLIIEAKIPHKNIKSFRFRVRTDQFRDLQDRVAAPIGMARNVILHQSLNERFVKAFVSCIDKNPRAVYSRLGELEPCFGCSSEIPNVKIEKRCTSIIEGARECRQCFCRPMWCVGCLGRIFAAKQEQERPDIWLDGQATCPTCRAEFCMLDVAFVVAEESQLDGNF
ncbi:hypothetical protein PFISCL1PPCAC_26742 [Pristionchus fissidentatus]|uniref:Transmembrane protein 129 n=1 Tax=Pristionchus fissidentatus TaxID=1538716 RepID=A0AAV5WXU2_9BILA|nr:hypothetical protein PFISCL1PPCAC_26742 [Pristionchus fissidentatus]